MSKISRKRIRSFQPADEDARVGYEMGLIPDDGR
jgi:hypothetical protein